MCTELLGIISWHVQPCRCNRLPTDSVQEPLLATWFTFPLIYSRTLSGNLHTIMHTSSISVGLLH